MHVSHQSYLNKLCCVVDGSSVLVGCATKCVGILPTIMHTLIPINNYNCTLHYVFCATMEHKKIFSYLFNVCVCVQRCFQMHAEALCGLFNSFLVGCTVIKIKYPSHCGDIFAMSLRTKTLLQQLVVLIKRIA